MNNASNGTDGQNGFLARLLRDSRGNTLALIAALMIPLVGLLGGGIDMSRLYLTKTRLQHACDAGALAGRKAMGTNAWTTSGTDNSDGVAKAMFDGNFKAGDYGTGTSTRSFAESDGSVTGTATSIVPMTIMQIFGITNRSLTVTCTAKLAIPNTDVMFVLDVTGSMNCVAGDAYCTNNGNVPALNGKIVGIKRAVKCFYEALVKVNTAEVCGASDPVATTYNQTAQIRIGFVPYSVNVNVGKLLPNTALADSWNYQTRVANYYVTNGPAWEVYGDSIDQSECLKYMKNESFSGFWPSSTSLGGGSYDQVAVTFPHDGVATSGGSDGEWSWSGAPDTSGTNRSCRRKRTETVTAKTYRLFKNWTYKQSLLDVSGLKAGGSTWNNSVSLPIGSSGANTSVAWGGCVEERNTVKNSDRTPAGEWDPIPTDAFDMDIDKPASSSVAGTQWGPLLPNAVYERYNSGGDTIDDVTTTDNLTRPTAYCTTEAKKLQAWDTAAPFETYVNSLVAIGNTYHDIGLIWGARFLSRTGMFATANDNKPRIDRHLIFMTDGDTMSYTDDYSAYGVHWWDRRQTTYAPVNNNGYDSDIANIMNAKLEGLCTAIKAKQITLWVISYGGGINADTEARLTACATTGKYYSATNTTTLISRFQQIAADIAELRLTN
ncbi:Tad domain-containing protein [Sphingobium sufflavum]|uniref:TadE/TadG family type IV pilus assembly protein n=1 Tax=Sphingobium sufflavum TaxID=1129547 RepID=UPI001F37DC0A|nr:TadE/TadG family type IV pilus assembly protein [Sphingobium sufflavum]MCE7797796.1 Tad domain-containing protein [Sphingobium sufflavum]